MLTILPATLIGVVETKLTLPDFSPSLAGLAYGANIHLLIALAAVCAASVLFWKLPEQSLVPAAVAVFFMAELSFTGAFWFLKSDWAPSLGQNSGKLFAGGTIIASLLAGVGLIWTAVKWLSTPRWANWSRGRPGIIGVLGIAALILINGSFAVRHYVGVMKGPDTAAQRGELSVPLPDVFFILVDTLRRDHLSYFGYSRPTSPNIDKLMSESYRFDSAYTPSSRTVPTVVSLFTGLYPTSHGVVRPFQGMPTNIPTIAELFHRSGYTTAAFVGNGLVSARQGFDRGFETFWPPSMPWWSFHGRTGLEALVARVCIPRDSESGLRINRQFFEWLDSTDGAGRFVYVHYMEPHSDYVPPQEDYVAVAPGIPRGRVRPPMFHEYANGTRFVDWQSLMNPPVVSEKDRESMIAGYDGEIHHVDRCVGELLDGLRQRGLLEEAHVVFLTDHGEEFADHGGWFHGHSIYEELTRSPLAYRPPGGVRGRHSIERPISLLDFTATLTERLGLDALPLQQGAPIPEVMDEPSPAERVPVVCSLPPQLYACRLGSWKLIRHGEPSNPVDMLYDLSTDGAEQVDLGSSLPDTLDMLRRYLEETIAVRATVQVGEVQPEVDPETLRRLRGLGYIK